MKPIPSKAPFCHKRKPAGQTHPRGFALIVTLSLMILLTVIAVGLLSLSSISLRSASQNEAMQAARANARMALLLAIGDLQKQLGPDTRISATADQVTGSDPAVSTTPQPQRQWTGAYNSWPAAAPAEKRPTPEFLQWFVSGNPTSLTNKAFAATTLPVDPKTSVEIVTAKTVGTTGDPVRVPLISQTATNNTKNNFAWWVSDLGTKALIGPAKDIPTAVAEVRADQQSAPASNLKSATSGTAKPFNTLSGTDPLLAKVTSFQSSALVASDPANIRGLFHDLTPQSRGLLTNVRSGGFRKDLSMELERPAATAPGSGAVANTPLYKVGTGTSQENGINFQELWSYYSICSPTSTRGLNRSRSATFTTGGSIASGTPTLQVEASPTACTSDEYFYFKQPVVISYQLALSFQTRVFSATETRLYLVIDPIVTLWNPLDVPVIVPTSAYVGVKYWQLPYDFDITVGTTTRKYPFAAIWRKQAEIDKGENGDANILSIRIGQSQQFVFKPGEVIKASQVGNSIVKGTDPVDHSLDAKAGFNYGGGVSVPIRDAAGNYLKVAATDNITVKCTPNDLTAGATATSGKMAITGAAVRHSRHYSLTHFEYYVGEDRSGLPNSLGIGAVAFDWDFGPKRLKITDPLRTSDTPGTKDDSTHKKDRYTADKRPGIFKTFTSRSILASALAAPSKEPFMLFSCNAKTEAGSIRGSRSLARFNPKALHADFYDMLDPELDMLPYELAVESIPSWKNGSLEVSPKGGAFFGGGLDGTNGTPFVTTHSVPREPIVSLAAFQHSFANGFDTQKPRAGDWTLNSREPLLPQISHAIGNSFACPVLASDQIEGTLPGGRPLADHSYLANQALWDDWFFSGIAPQTISTFSKPRPQKQVATDFFNGTGKLPVDRFKPDLLGKDPATIVSTYFPSTTPSAAATAYIASLIRVDGMFNVNSTSVEAWKCLLGGRKDRPVVIRDANGKESVKSDGSDTPVAGLLGPVDKVASGTSMGLNQEEQWIGRRTLNDEEIDRLARGIVKEVRKRGPFLSLADFVNRRVGSDKDLARAGAIQNALDSKEAKINEAYQSDGRATTATHFNFAEAEQGPISQGAPGIVKQADILTPIAPILSARSDSFLIRAYGEKTDAAGKVIARAWCEAVVQRSPQFVDPSADTPDKAYASISPLNKKFGRRFDIISFRWLNSLEA